MTKLKSPNPTSLEMQIQLRVCCSSLPVHLHSKSCPRRFPFSPCSLFSLFPLLYFPYISLFLILLIFSFVFSFPNRFEIHRAGIKNNKKNIAITSEDSDKNRTREEEAKRKRQVKEAIKQVRTNNHANKAQ